MISVKNAKLDPGIRIRQFTTDRAGVIVAPPPGQWFEPGRTWVDFGNGPELVEDDTIGVMVRHIRLTIRHNPQDPVDDLTQVGRLQRDLQVYASTDIDKENPFCETHRNANRDDYFEFATEFTHKVEKMLRERVYEDRVTMEDLGEVGLICPRCGFFAGYVTVCPNCHFREVDPCPHCGHPIATDYYKPLGGGLYLCPKCGSRVHMQFNPDLERTPYGSLPEPVVIIQDA
jgi:hypothetical protein